MTPSPPMLLRMRVSATRRNVHGKRGHLEKGRRQPLDQLVHAAFPAYDACFFNMNEILLTLGAAQMQLLRKEQTTASQTVSAIFGRRSRRQGVLFAAEHAHVHQRSRRNLGKCTLIRIVTRLGAKP
jgi:hypothetical protein